MRGESFLRLAQGKAPERDGDAFIQISETEIGWRDGSGDPKSDVYLERYLYDRHRDPAESINLIGRYDYQDVTDSLREQLRTYLQEIEGADPEIKPSTSSVTMIYRGDRSGALWILEPDWWIRMSNGLK